MEEAGLGMDLIYNDEDPIDITADDDDPTYNPAMENGCAFRTPHSTAHIT